MTTREQALKTAGACIAEAYAILDDPAVPVAEAARKAYTPTGPPLDELVRRITERRAANAPGPRAPSAAAAGVDGPPLPTSPRQGRAGKKPA